MFSITLVNIDSYQSSPIPELDVTFSEFRGSEVKKVPVIRAFGSTATGKKTCLHIHGVFPYLYVPCIVQQNTDSYAYQLAAAIDSALNTSFGSTLSTNQHVYKIQRVSGIPFYGYHEKEHLFFKIYFYNPAIIKRTADLLQNSAILNQTLQPYEAHIPYILQFMIDYNLYGMNLINLNSVKYRHSLQGCTTEASQSRSSMDLLDSQAYLPISITRQSMCELEVDVHASEILNRQSINEKLELNPGLAAIWNEEKARRTEAGLEHAKSQLLYPKTPNKVILPPTSNDVYQKDQLLKRLNVISQTNETITSNMAESSYPIEIEDNKNVLNASHILNHSESLVSEENLERTVSDNYKLLQLASSAFLDATRSQMDADDIQLVDMLANLAEENEITSNVDNDSVLGSQYSMFSERLKDDPEEEEVDDLNITSFDLDLSSWESMYNQRSNQHDNMVKVVDNKQNIESADDSNVNEKNDENDGTNNDTDNGINNVNVEKIDKTTIHESTQDRQDGTENSEKLIKTNKEVRKRLSFLDYDEEDTFVKSDHNVNQSKTLTTQHSNNHIDTITFISSNANSDDSVPNSQCTEKSINDISPERDYASDIRNLAKKFIKSHSDVIPETDLDDDEEDVCNTTFTQHLNQKIESDSQSSSLDRRTCHSSKNAIITITTKYKPPSPRRICESMTMYGIPKCRSQKPFFGNKFDLAKQKEFLNTNAPYFDEPAFKSSLEEITSIKLWRRMKVNEFYPSGANIKSHHMKRTLAGYNLLTITPLIEPPSSKNVKDWIRAKKYISKKNSDTKLCKQNKEKALNVQHPSINATNKEIKFQPGMSNNLINNDSNVERHIDSPMPQQSMLNRTSDETRKSEIQNSNNSSISEKSLDPSLKKALENPLLHKQDKTQLGISYGQIECSSKGSYGSNVSNENLQKARAVTVHQYLTLLSLEVHVVTRKDLLPDPQYDSIAALFYAIYNDAPTDATTDEQIEHAAIIVNSNSISARLNKIHSTSARCPILYVATEQDAFNSLIKLIEQHNPDILLGWEVETLSWGYVFQRALHLGLNNFPVRISKVPHMQIYSKSDAHAVEKDDIGDIKVPGRNLLDVWRIMRHEAALLTYTFENVMHHVLHERIPCPSFKTLSTWWKQESMIIKSRVIHHYVIRVVGTLKLLNHLDVIGRTCELARLFGIQFYEVFSRGSQFRVESMMLRLAKPMNYIPISPSIHQRAKMRAPECLPLIMEPESKFYTDPLIVLDFQSLYPSMIIAYNYCFSTCLGRIEHIGQYGPFEFGAATLKVRKNTALKLQDKINFSPCGVVFVKKEVRQGILPRMLSEILNTRLMVKESMKLHPAENRTLQRILHSQQLGLKLIANVTYGYTSANFSGRMPCIEIGDSVVSKGRETLERAIKLVETTPRWGARVVYGDTDSLFILLPGKSRQEAFTIGEEIADAVTAINPPPVKLKFEKVLHPSILQTKKRYCGYMYETRDQEKPEFLAKGIETVRRDGCPAVSKNDNIYNLTLRVLNIRVLQILEKALKILFETKDVSLVKQYVIRQFDKIFQRRVSILDLTFAKEFRGMRGYKANACVPALELTRRLIKKDPRAVPRTSERVRYVIVAGAPNQALIHCVRTPMEVVTDPSLIPNSIYYITKVIIPPLNRCFNLFGIDVNAWYKEISHRSNFDNVAHLGGDNPKSTILQFFSSTSCITCGEQTNKEICPDCLLQPNRTVLVLLEKIKQLERNYQQITTICHSCIRRLGDVECVSLDCPVLYRMAQARKELAQVSYMNNIIYGNNSSGIKELNAVAEWY
ncbi:DNA polymerase zeta catalytic subunit [Cyphomyrmex costatus]|uniref:DNA polymerase n=1 Tax=Cyphomyrmex costatus TaxID=456900 RepID=A0A195CG23_9HYME|nr:DNA polymerase zeta catalytic subunit [Cyphomyrmex costatus]